MFRSKSLLRCTQAVLNNHLGNKTSGTSLSKLIKDKERFVFKEVENQKYPQKKNRLIKTTDGEIITPANLNTDKSKSVNILTTIKKNIKETISNQKRSSSCSTLSDITKRSLSNNNIYENNSNSQTRCNALNNPINSNQFIDNLTNLKTGSNEVIKNVSNSAINRNDTNGEDIIINAINFKISYPDKISAFNSFAHNLEKTNNKLHRNIQNVPLIVSENDFKVKEHELVKCYHLTNSNNELSNKHKFFRQVTNETEIMYRDERQKVNIKIKENHSSVTKIRNNYHKIKKSQSRDINTSYQRSTHSKFTQKVKFLKNVKTTIKKNLFYKNIPQKIPNIYYDLQNWYNPLKENRVRQERPAINLVQQNIFSNSCLKPNENNEIFVGQFKNFFDTNIENYYSFKQNHTSNNKTSDREHYFQNVIPLNNRSSSWHANPNVPGCIVNNDFISRQVNTLPKRQIQNFRTSTNTNITNKFEVEELVTQKHNKKQDSLPDNKAKCHSSPDRTTKTNDIKTTLVREKLNTNLKTNMNAYFSQVIEHETSSNITKGVLPIKYVQLEEPSRSPNTIKRKLEETKSLTTSKECILRSIYTTTSKSVTDEKYFSEILIQNNLLKEISKHENQLKSIYDGKNNIYKQNDTTKVQLRLSDGNNGTDNKNIVKNNQKVSDSDNKTSSGPLLAAKKRAMENLTQNVTEKKSIYNTEYNVGTDFPNPKMEKDRCNISKESGTTAWEAEKYYEQMNGRLIYTSNNQLQQQKNIKREKEKSIISNKTETIAWEADKYYERMNGKVIMYPSENKESMNEKNMQYETEKRMHTNAWLKGQHYEQIQGKLDLKQNIGQNQCSYKDNIRMKTSHAVAWKQGEQNYMTKHSTLLRSKTDFDIRKQQKKSNQSSYPQDCNDYIKAVNSENLIIKPMRKPTSEVAWMRKECKKSEKHLFTNFQDKIERVQNNKNNSQTLVENETEFYSVKSNTSSRKKNDDKTIYKNTNCKNDINSAIPWMKSNNISLIEEKYNKTSKMLDATNSWIRGQDILSNKADFETNQNLNTAIPYKRGQDIIRTNENHSRTPANLTEAVPWVRSSQVSRSQKINANNIETSKNIKNISNEQENQTPTHKQKSIQISEHETIKKCTNIGGSFNGSVYNVQQPNEIEQKLNTSNVNFNYTKDKVTRFCNKQNNRTDTIYFPTTCKNDSNNTLNDCKNTTEFKVKSEKELSVLWAKDEKVKFNKNTNNQKTSKSSMGQGKITAIDALLVNINKQLSELPLNKNNRNTKHKNITFDVVSAKEDKNIINSKIKGNAEELGIKSDSKQAITSNGTHSDFLNCKSNKDTAIPWERGEITGKTTKSGHQGKENEKQINKKHHLNDKNERTEAPPKKKRSLPVIEKQTEGIVKLFSPVNPEKESIIEGKDFTQEDNITRLNRKKANAGMKKTTNNVIKKKAKDDKMHKPKIKLQQPLSQSTTTISFWPNNITNFLVPPPIKNKNCIDLNQNEKNNLRDQEEDFSKEVNLINDSKNSNDNTTKSDILKQLTTKIVYRYFQNKSPKNNPLENVGISDNINLTNILKKQDDNEIKLNKNLSLNFSDKNRINLNNEITNFENQLICDKENIKEKNSDEAEKIVKLQAKRENEKPGTCKQQKEIEHSHKNVADKTIFHREIEIAHKKETTTNIQFFENSNNPIDDEKKTIEELTKEIKKISKDSNEDNMTQTKSNALPVNDKTHVQRIAEFYDFEERLLGFTRPQLDSIPHNFMHKILKEPHSVITPKNSKTASIIEPIISLPINKINDTKLQHLNNPTIKETKSISDGHNNSTEIGVEKEQIKKSYENQVTDLNELHSSETIKTFQDRYKEISTEKFLNLPPQKVKSKELSEIYSQPQPTKTDTELTEAINGAQEVRITKHKKEIFKPDLKENVVKYITELHDNNLFDEYDRMFFVKSQENTENSKESEQTNKIKKTTYHVVINNTYKPASITAVNEKTYKQINELEAVSTNDSKKVKATTQTPTEVIICLNNSNTNQRTAKNVCGNVKPTFQKEIPPEKMGKQREVTKSNDEHKSEENFCINKVTPLDSRRIIMNKNDKTAETLKGGTIQTDGKDVELLSEQQNSSLNINMLKEIFDNQINELSYNTMGNRTSNQIKEEKNAKYQLNFNLDKTEILKNDLVTVCVPHESLSAQSVLIKNEDAAGKTSQKNVTPIIKTMLNAVVYTIFKNENTYNELTQTEKANKRQETAHIVNTEEKKQPSDKEEHANKRKPDSKKKNPFIMPINETRFPMINDKKSTLQYPKSMEMSIITQNDEMIYRHVPSVSKVLNETLPESTKLDLEKWEHNHTSYLGRIQFEEFYREQLKNDTKFHDCIRRHILGTPLNILQENADSRLHGSLKSIKGILSQLSDITVLESPVVHPELPYHGIVDCVGCYNNKPVIIEWKQADQRKSTLDFTYDAPIQLSAYIGAINHDQHYKLPIQNGIVVMAYTDGSPADVLQLPYEECLNCWKLWLERLNKYLLLKN